MAKYQKVERKIKEVPVFVCPGCKTIHRGDAEMLVCAKCGWYNQDIYIDSGNGLRNKMKALKKINPALWKEIVKNEKRIRLGKKPLPSMLELKDEPNLHSREHAVKQELKAVDRKVPSK